MAIKSINYSIGFNFSGADPYPDGFYGAHRETMPEDGWVTKIGATILNMSSNTGSVGFIITGQSSPGVGSDTSVLYWQSSSTTPVPPLGSWPNSENYEQDVPNVFIEAGTQICIIAYPLGGSAVAYQGIEGSSVYDGPYGGGPVPPPVPLENYTRFESYRFAHYIYYSDTAPATGTGGVKFWNGAGYVTKDVKFFNGSTYVKKPLKFHNGSAWEPTP